MKTRKEVSSAKRWVIKVGSALLTADGSGLNRQLIADWVSQIAQLHATSREIILVSSGAVAEGMHRLHWAERPHALNKLQAAAAVGQMGLVGCYEECFSQFGLHTAQVLLTHDDLADRKRYLNSRSSLNTLLSIGAIPVVNENDTVAVDEIQFGDNDSLAALVTNLVTADMLLILTDQDGLFDKDPRHNSHATLISHSPAGNPELEQYCDGATGRLGRGGMKTKLRAAKIAARSGACTLIANGREKNIIQRIVQGEQLGTFLIADQEPDLARKQWLAGQLQLAGRLLIDDGAVRALKESGKSLLPVGVQQVSGQFTRGEVVACVDVNGIEVARGLVNYSAAEAKRIAGNGSEKIESILGYVDEPELIHRDNLVLI
ncbi:MAG TPA: glutamate 5-kinase [Gammaproteobacteria bacterium]|nr:glutamate 5-kinase [Gammaproteobacteria bacterium]